MSAEPFQNRGRIEKALGERNRAAVDRVMEHDISSIPENAVRSEQARKLPHLYRGDFSMRRDDYGRVWVERTRTDPTPEEGQDPSVQLERWDIYRSLPFARFGTWEYIVKPYGRGGSERSLREQAARIVTGNINRLQSAKTSHEELEEMNTANLEELFRLRYQTTTIPGRRHTAELLDKATRPDSRNRVNAPASRVIENAARVQIIEDLVLDDVKHGNAQEQVDKMDAVSAYIESVVEYAASRAESVSQERVGTRAFEIDADELREEFLTLLSPNRGIIIAQPYLGLVTGIRHALYAKGDPDDLMRLAQRMSLEDALRIFKTPHIPYKKLEPEDRQKLIASIAKELRICVDDARRVRVEGPKPREPKPKKKTKVEEFWERVEKL